MAVTLVKEVLWRASNMLNDYSPQFTRWVETDLVGHLDDAQAAVSKYLPFSCSRVDAIKLATGTKQHLDKILAASIIPGDGSAAADTWVGMIVSVNRNEGSDGLTPGRVIRLTDLVSMDASDPMWHTKSSSTISRYAFNPITPKVFWVYPGVPASTDVWVQVSYVALPKKIPNTGGLYAYSGGNTTTISVDDKYVDDLVNYIVARAALKDAEEAGMAQLFSLCSTAFVNSINAQSVAALGINPNLQSLPLTPALPAAAK